MGCDMWFGTKEYSRWVPTPQTGADVSSSAWSDDGGFLNGAGYALNSRGSHKRYVFSWGSSNARETAQLFKSYFDGSFGRGKLYLIDPLTTSTNVLPARWADPSIGLDYESPSLVPGTLPTRSSASGFERLQLPVASASYSLTGSPAQTVSKETVVENLFTNPRLKGDGTYAEVARNLFTNPRFKGDGTWAEVRHNYAQNPCVGGSLAYLGGTRVALSSGTDYARGTITDAALSTFAQRLSPNAATASPGDVFTLSARGRTTAAGQRMAMAIQFLDASNSQVGWGSAPETVVNSSTFTPLNPVVAAVAPAGTAKVIAWIGIAGTDARAVGDTVDVQRVLLEKSPTVNGYFDGSMMDASMPQPEDFRVRWLGTPNASESVMEIERVRGLTAGRCIAGVSTRDGKPAMRLIPTDTASADSYATMTVPVDARPVVTVLGTSSSNGPISSPTVNPLRVATFNPFTSFPRPNDGNTVAQRWKSGTLTSSFGVRWYHGGLLGSGDVWWTDIGLYAGDYQGENFHGSFTPEDSTLAQPEDFRWRWTGAVDNSESVMEIEQVAEFNGFTAIAGVSTKAGKPAVRLIPRESEPTSMAYALVPVTAPSVTAVATVTLDAPLQSPPDYLAPTLSAGGAADSAPNLAGAHPLRAIGGEPDSGYVALAMANSATPGDGHTWWTDIGLYAGDYTGPNFTGADGTVQYNGETLRTEWAGVEDNSVSRAVRFRTTGTPRITENNSLFVPIPDGHQLNLGAFYSASGGGGVWAVSATAGGGIGDVITPLTQLDGTSSNLFPDVITKPPGIIGAYIWIGSVGSSTGSSVTINAMHARISPVGEPPKGENMWIGGQGNEGVRFAGPPTYINVNGRDGGRIEFAATFVESVL